MCPRWTVAILTTFMLFLIPGPGISPAGAEERPEAGIVLAQARQSATRQTRVPLQNVPESQLRERINAWVVGLAAGKLEGAPIRLAEELSRVLDDGDNMQVLPIITRGPSYNVHALLYLRGIDLAVINADVLDFFKKQKNLHNIGDRINYVTQLFMSEVHVLVRPEIKSLEDLAGKPVNFNTKGTSAAFSGPAVLDRLGIKVKKKFIPHPVAMQKMRQSGDEVAAVVFVTGKPVRPLAKKKWPPGFHLVPVPFNEKVADYFLPSTLEHADYPDLIPEGQVISTIAVPTVLAAYNWKPNHPRYHKVKRFVQYMFKRWNRLLKKPFHPKWRNINLAAEVPGWKRLPAVQEELDKRRKTARRGRQVNAALARKQAAKAAPNDPVEQERIFNEFMKWYAKRGGQ